MQVNKAAYSETLSQFRPTGLFVSFDELNNVIEIKCTDIDAALKMVDHTGYDSIGELESELNETYRALCEPRYNVITSLDTIGEVNAFLAKTGIKGVRVTYNGKDLDLNELENENE